MGERSLELTIISAKDLNKAKYLIGKMDVYAVAYIYGAWNHDQKQKTHVHKDGESNPVWNYPMRFMIDESAALQNRLTLVVKIKTGGMFGDTDVGSVCVPLKELLEGSDSSGNRPFEFVSYQLRTPSGKLRGDLSFSYKFGEKSAGEPVTAYPTVGSESSSSSAYPPPVYATPVGAAMGSCPPAPAGAAPGAYPPGGGYYYYYPQQAGYGYGSYPPPGYGGYPPPGYGYGYPPIQQQEQPQKKSRFGLGLLGGLLCGLLVGGIAMDAANFGGCGGGCGG